MFNIVYNYRIDKNSIVIEMFGWDCVCVCVCVCMEVKRALMQLCQEKKCKGKIICFDNEH